MSPTFTWLLLTFRILRCNMTDPERFQAEGWFLMALNHSSIFWFNKDIWLVKCATPASIIYNGSFMTQSWIYHEISWTLYESSWNYKFYLAGVLEQRPQYKYYLIELLKFLDLIGKKFIEERDGQTRFFCVWN